MMPEDWLLSLLTRARHTDYNVSKILTRNYKDNWEIRKDNIRYTKIFSRDSSLGGGFPNMVGWSDLSNIPRGPILLLPIPVDSFNFKGVGFIPNYSMTISLIFSWSPSFKLCLCFRSRTTIGVTTEDGYRRRISSAEDLLLVLIREFPNDVVCFEGCLNVTMLWLATWGTEGEPWAILSFSGPLFP
jgi:hypothetical protein